MSEAPEGPNVTRYRYIDPGSESHVGRLDSLYVQLSVESALCLTFAQLRDILHLP
jgi:hypothetical protein